MQSLAKKKIKFVTKLSGEEIANYHSIQSLKSKQKTEKPLGLQNGVQNCILALGKVNIILSVL